MDDLNLLTKKLLPYAYNILGNIDDSKDVIQDVLIRYNEKDSSSIANPTAYLIKAAINTAINLKNKKDRERQRNINLPEPVVTNQGEHNIEQTEILNYSMLVLLDSLNTKERSVFLLKELFDYGHNEIAEILDISIENSRQLLTRAKKKLKLQKPTIKKATTESNELLNKYVKIIRNGDVKALEKMLSEEVKVLADGGNKVNIVAQLTIGIDNTIKLMTYLYEYYQKDFEIKIEEVNHQPALLFYENKTLINCQIFEFSSEEKITNIFSVVDPDKLRKI